jgi:hypothetical protein
MQPHEEPLPEILPTHTAAGPGLPHGQGRHEPPPGAGSFAANA